MNKIIVTTGEPAGIGPDISLFQCQHAQQDILIFIADTSLIKQRAALLNISIELIEVTLNNLPHTASLAGQMYILPLALKQPCIAGELNSQNAEYVLSMLKISAQACIDQQVDAIVTAPVQKSVINDAGFEFSGHTEYFQHYCGSKDVVMMLATEGLKVSLVTTHLPLKDVAAAVTKTKLRQVIDILSYDLNDKFGIKRPNILVAGLNPHAGEGGHLGMEEIETIIPVLEEYDANTINLIGPLPADTLFTDKYLQNADAVLAMYHDQGLPVLKYKGFGNAANITLGLPIIRTSVDHGTALDLAGTGQINMGSFDVALHYAREMSIASKLNS
jgi:4-hydroxythreonine-4-phosphate dehydrogenase